MITAKELKEKTATRPRLKMDDVVDFYEDLQTWLINAAAQGYMWTNTFFSCTKSSFKSMDDFEHACNSDLLPPLEALDYNIRVQYFIGINEEWTISIWLGWED